jgi:tRNA(fMet)-specific endonuclease VapC
MARLVLDASAWIQIERLGQEVGDVISPSDHVFVPTTVLGELKVGEKFVARMAKRNTAPQIKSRSLVNACLEIAEYAPTTKVTAEIYAELKIFAMTEGKPRGQNDLWIAASAIELRAELVTLDRRARFEGLPGLVIRD